MSETFLSRWSRRKREASIPPPQGEGGEDHRSEPGGGASPPPGERVESPPHPEPLPASEEREIAHRAGGREPRGAERQALAFDPASLPPIESIAADTDVSAFMRPGVPADLAQAALRRAWVTDPAIRDFVGPAENAWDFNAPGGVPGFGPLDAIEDVQRLAAQVAGMLSSATPEAGAEEGKTIAEGNQVPAQMAVASQPEAESPPDDVAPQKDAPEHDA
jgi:Protein of unknown function (DUF3306)